MSDKTITFTLKDLLTLAIHSSWAAQDDETQIRFLQWMAHELQYEFGIDRNDLTQVGFPENTTNTSEDTSDMEENEEEEQKN